MSENPSSKHHLTVKGLVKYFGDDRAVDDITFGIPEGKFLALLGPLRRGKTTTLMSIAGLHKPDAGEIKLGETTSPRPRITFTCPPRSATSGW
jgi:ABC-type Fe3+/spermidine/putrescine transport system ATPase subunit